MSRDSDRLPDPRIGRHFYDIHRLLGDAAVQGLLQNQAQVADIVREIADVTRRFFIKPDEDIEISPADGFAASPAFQLGSEISERLRVPYEATMPQLYFGTDALPEWGAICDRVSASGV